VGSEQGRRIGLLDRNGWLRCHVRARPVDDVTYAEAAQHLGATPSTVRRHVITGRLRSGERGEHRALSRADVEALAPRLYRRRDHIADVDPYCVTGQRAADILGVNVARLNQLANKGFLPFETHDGAPVLPARAVDDGGERPGSPVAPERERLIGVGHATKRRAGIGSGHQEAVHVVASMSIRASWPSMTSASGARVVPVDDRGR
jgi:excisionase family DNA binding protein